MSLEALDVSYATPGGVTILHDITLRLPPGTIIGLGGPSGAGKSTLARILAGHLRPSRGEVLCQRRADAPDRPGAPRTIRPAVGRTRHRPRLDRRADPGQRRRAGPAHARCARGPAGLPMRRPGGTVGGRVAARVAGAAPWPGHAVLVCDEITAQLDPLSERILWTELMALTSARGIGVLVISHDAMLRHRLTDRNIELADGRISG